MTVTTEHFYSGNNSTTSFAYTFPYYKTSDIKVKVGGTLKTESTHYNITGTNVVFTSGNVPPNGTNNIHIYRETDVDTSKATFAAGSSIRATDLNNNETQLLYHAQEQNFNKIQTADVEDKAITSDKILDGTIATADIADNAVTAAKLATNSIDATNLAANSVGASELANDAVDTDAIADDAVTSAKIATGAVIADSIGTNAVTTAKIYNEAVETAKIDDGAVTTAKINNAAVTADKLGTDSVITAKILDANVTTNKIANDSVTTDKLENSINSSIAANTAKTTNATHTGEVTGATSLTITNSAVVTDRIADDAVTAAKLANSINAEIAANTAKTSNVTHTGEVTGSGALTIANDAVTTAKIADNAVTTAKIEDAELTTLAGMQSGTASILASGTALTSTTAELNLLDGKSIVTAVSGSSTDVQLPTAKAVNDQIVALMQAAGGYYPIADEISFPNANPDPNNDAGTIVSIADAGGVVVNGSGVSTTGRTLGGATVTINGIDSSLNSSTIAAGKGMLVQTTSTLNTYTYHRLVVDEAGVANAQSLVSDFNERYRTGASNPTSSLDDGDLFFNTSSDKMLVYNATSSAWEEVQSVGNYFINTISSYSGTGGNNATFNGSAYRFVLSNPGTYAEQHIVSVNGVIQKPNSGTSQPSEGFAIDGSSIIFSAAPATGSDFFIITIGASVNIGTPSNNTVSTAIIQNGAVTTAKIAADAIDGTKIADDAVGAEHIELLDAPLHIADATNLVIGTGSDLKLWHYSDNSYIRNETGNLTIEANGAGDDAIKIVPDGAVELYFDNSKKAETTSSGFAITGILSSNQTSGQAISLADNVRLDLGTGDDLQIQHTGSNAHFDNNTGSSYFNAASNFYFQTNNTESAITCTANGAVQLYFDNSQKLTTSSTGVEVSGNVHVNDSDNLQCGNSADLKIYHNGSNTYLDNNTGTLILTSAGDVELSAADDYTIYGVANGAVRIYYDGAQKFETTSAGTTTTGNATFTGHIYQGDNDAHFFGDDNDITITHDGSNSYIDHSGAGDLYIRTLGSQEVIRLNAAKDIELRVASGNDSAAKFIGDAAVELYYDGVRKAYTNSGGFALDSHLIMGDGDIVKLGNGADLQLTHDGTDTTITNNTGNLLIYSANDFYIKHGTEVMLAAKGDAAVELYYNNSKKFSTTDYGCDAKTIKPDADDTHDLGASDQRWDDVYATNGTIQTSDRNAKKDIVKSDLGLTFINAVEPVSYKFKTGTRTHYGVIAQDLETVLDGKDFAGLTKDTETGNYGVRYSELISPLIKAIQELLAEVETLKTKVAALEAK